MAEEATPVCPTLVQQLTDRLSNPYVAFAFGVAAASGGPQLVSLVKTLIGA